MKKGESAIISAVLDGRLRQNEIIGGSKETKLNEVRVMPLLVKDLETAVRMTTVFFYNITKIPGWGTENIRSCSVVLSI